MLEILKREYKNPPTTMLISVGMCLGGILIEKTAKMLSTYLMGSSIADISYPITPWLFIAGVFYAIAAFVNIVAVFLAGLTSDKHWWWKVPLLASLIIFILEFAQPVFAEIYTSILGCVSLHRFILCR